MRCGLGPGSGSGLSLCRIFPGLARYTAFLIRAMHRADCAKHATRRTIGGARIACAGKWRAALVGAFALAPILWAGQEYPALPGQAVVPNQVLVRYKPGTVGSSVLATLAAGSQIQALSHIPNLYLVQLPAGTSAAYSTQLSQHPLIDYVEPNRIRHATLQSPNDVFFQNQWDLQTIQAQQAWQLLPSLFLTAGAATAGRIKIGVIDSGADCTHPDFVNAGGTSPDVASGGQILFASSQALVQTTIPHAVCLWQDDFGHGTHVSGTIAAATNNAIGVAALGYPVELIEYKALDSTGMSTDAEIADAIGAAVDAGANIISLSLGERGYSHTLQIAVNLAWQNNCLVVASAGNNGANELFFPGGANYAVDVAATDQYDNRAWFSDFGPSVGIAAPGVNILSTLPTYTVPLTSSLTYGTLSGTSMATPHVVALAGLIEMATPNLSAMAVAQRIQQSADSTLADGGWGQEQGYGRINAFRAISGNLRTASVGGLVGQVVDDTGAPIASATVTVDGQSFTTDTIPTGLFRFSNLPAGNTYTIATSAASYPAATEKAAVIAGADTNVTIALGVTTGEFTGIVSDAGVPLAGVVVQALSSGLIQATSATDAAGAYSLLVPPGTHDIRASAMFSVTATISAQSVSANGSTVVNIPMARMGSISGTVVDASNQPIANAQIIVANSTYSAGAITDSNGNFFTIGVPAATYTVTVTAPGFAGAPITGVIVANDQVTIVNFSSRSVTVTTSPSGLTFTVDGAKFTAQQTFNWASGSVHTLGVTNLQTGSGARYAFSSWTIVGATYTANFNASYSLTLAASPSVGGALVANPTSADGYYASGTSVQITASPNAGYGFVNFSGDLTGSTNSQSVIMTAPRSVMAIFAALTGVTITTSPPGLNITVDGQSYAAPRTFSWAQGSVHTVAVSSPQSGPPGTRCAWSNWSDSGAISHSITAPASGASVTYTASFNVSYLLTLAVVPSGGGTLTASPASPDGYYNSGAAVQVTASANSGYQFANFSGDLTGSPNPQSVSMIGPRAVTANFSLPIIVNASPSFLSVTVDGSVYTVPQTFNWVPGSSHTLTVSSPQNGPPGTRYAWSNWSDGGAMLHVISVPGTPTTYNATFIAQYLLTLAASPSVGGALVANPTSADGYYASGTSVQVTASANSAYGLVNFSGDLAGSTNPQFVTMTAPRSVTANFALLTQVTLATNPVGLGITVDGQSYTAPQTFNWAQGSIHTVAVSSPQSVPPGTRCAWSNWSDGGAISHSITAPASGASVTYTASFNASYLLTLAVAPSGGGTLTASPASPDGYYNSGAAVQVTASASSGYQFATFLGDVTGSTNPQSVSMMTPRSVTANFRSVLLAAYWKLDEPNGASSFSDASGNGNNGACGSVCPTMGVPGKLGTAAFFYGNSQITVPDSSSLRLNQFTIAVWVYPTQTKTDFQPLIVKEDSAGNNRNYGLFIVPNSMQIRYAAWGSDCTTRFAASSVGQLAQNTWNQIVFTYDGSVEKLYLNGVLDSSNAASAGSLCQAAVPVKLGMETSAFLPFTGVLDEVEIYNQALSAEVVSIL